MKKPKQPRWIRLIKILIHYFKIKNREIELSRKYYLAFRDSLFPENRTEKEFAFLALQSSWDEYKDWMIYRDRCRNRIYNLIGITPPKSVHTFYVF